MSVTLQLCAKSNSLRRERKEKISMSENLGIPHPFVVAAEALVGCKFRYTPESSNVLAIGYKRADWKLYVVYKGPSLYLYSNVEPELVGALLFAPSVGTYLANAVKPSYDCVKVGTDGSVGGFQS